MSLFYFFLRKYRQKYENSYNGHNQTANCICC